MRAIRRRLWVLVVAGCVVVGGLPAFSPGARGQDGEDGLPCKGDAKSRLYDVKLTYGNHREEPNRGAPTKSDFQQTVNYPGVKVRTKRCKGNPITLLRATSALEASNAATARYSGSDAYSHAPTGVQPCTWDFTETAPGLKLDIAASVRHGSVPEWTFSLVSSFDDPLADTAFRSIVEGEWEKQCPGHGTWYISGPIREPVGSDLTISIDGLTSFFQFDSARVVAGPPPTFLDALIPGGSDADGVASYHAANVPYLPSVPGAKFSASIEFTRLEKKKRG